MCYVTAKQVLPIEVIEMIQNYIDGEYIYIPKKEGNKQQWGTTTNTRKELSVRNSKIYIDYKNGVSRRELAEKYFLSIKSIDRSVLKEKSK